MQKKNQVIIYTDPGCPYCKNAKKILNDKGVTYQEINILENPEQFKAIKLKYSVNSVPQIFVNVRIDGESNLKELEQNGKLDCILNDPNI